MNLPCLLTEIISLIHRKMAVAPTSILSMPTQAVQMFSSSRAAILMEWPVSLLILPGLPSHLNEMEIQKSTLWT